MIARDIIKPSVVLPIGLVMAGLFIAFLWGLKQEHERHLENRFEQVLKTVDKFYHHKLQDNVKSLRLAAYDLKNNPELKRLMAAGDREALYRQARPYFDNLLADADISHFYFHGPRAVNFLRVHQPDRYGDQIQRHTMISALERGDESYGVEIGPLGTFTLRYVTPYFNNVVQLGYLELGIEVSSIFDYVASSADVGLHVLIDSNYLNSFGGLSESAQRGREFARLREVAIYGRSGEAKLEDVSATLHKVLDSSAHMISSADESSYYLGKIALSDVAERDVGYLVVQGDYSHDIRQMNTVTTYMAVTALVLGALLAATFYSYTSRMERRLQSSRRQTEEEVRARLDQKGHYDKELQRVSLYDRTTGLPGRQLLIERLSQCVLLADRECKPVTLMVVDVKRMTEINDTFGYSVGDKVLLKLGIRIVGVVRKSDIVAHLDSDLFAIVMPSMGARLGVLAAEKVHSAFMTPVEIDGMHLDVDAHIGLAVYPDHADNKEALLQRADIAVRQAKSSYNTYSLYSERDDRFSKERLTLFGELRRTIKSGNELQLFYQPKVNVAERRVIGVEALVRWQHPTRGFIPPAMFVPLAEQTGLIGPLTDWVLSEAFAQARRWQDQGLNLCVSVNLSAQNMADPELPAKLQQMAAAHGVVKSRIMLEITETSIMNSVEKSLDVMTLLHKMGFNFSIDDFGTGYSSLVYLSKLPVSEIKIDQTFVFNLLKNKSDAAIVKSTIELAHGLDLSVCCEGVEEYSIWQQLEHWRADVIQGYFVAKPMPESEFGAWLSDEFDTLFDDKPLEEVGRQVS